MAQLLMLFLTLFVGIGLGIACYPTIKQRRKLFVIGHFHKGRTYLFRLPIRRDNFVGTFEEAVTLTRLELANAGVPEDVLESVQIRISGCFIEVTGSEELIAEIERLHTAFLTRRYWSTHKKGGASHEEHT